MRMIRNYIQVQVKCKSQKKIFYEYLFDNAAAMVRVPVLAHAFREGRRADRAANQCAMIALSIDVAGMSHSHWTKLNGFAVSCAPAFEIVVAVALPPALSRGKRSFACLDLDIIFLPFFPSPSDCLIGEDHADACNPSIF